MEFQRWRDVVGCEIEWRGAKVDDTSRANGLIEARDPEFVAAGVL
jgi:hypothetical protein